MTGPLIEKIYKISSDGINYFIKRFFRKKFYVYRISDRVAKNFQQARS